MLHILIYITDINTDDYFIKKHEEERRQTGRAEGRWVKVLKKGRTCLLVQVYLQKASLKAAGLLSREKAVVVPRENHLRRNRCSQNRKKKHTEKTEYRRRALGEKQDEEMIKKSRKKSRERDKWVEKIRFVLNWKSRGGEKWALLEKTEPKIHSTKMKVFNRSSAGTVRAAAAWRRTKDGFCGKTNLDSENLITVQTCVRAVVRRTLKTGMKTTNQKCDYDHWQ